MASSVKPLVILICSLLGFAAPPLVAKDRPFIDEYDNTIREDLHAPEWREGEFKMPQGYREQDLQEFQLDDSSGRFRYYIDRNSLQSDADGVYRFVLVIRSESGAENSSYEGIHCGARQYKVYAYGNRKGFNPIRKAEWQRISKSGRENYRNTLYSNLLCNLNTGKPNPPQAVFRAMQNHSTVKSSPFIQE